MNTPKRRTIRICHGLSCMSNFSEDLYFRAKERAEAVGTIEIEKCHCLNMCERGPNVAIGRTVLHEMTTELLDQQISQIAGDAK